MKKIQRGLFFHRLYKKKEHFPLQGQIELTYRCNLNCIHCYCKGLESVSGNRLAVSAEHRKPNTANRTPQTENGELTTGEWKKILDEIHKEGCLSLCLTGGDPLIREDFLEIYSYAKERGFIITIFTNGTTLTPKIINYLVKSVPFSIEITLNGITQNTYESITQVPGSFFKVMQTINLLKEKKIPFIIKTNCLKQNMHEISQIKAFAGILFANLPKNKFLFGYGTEIHPRLNLDKAPILHRLSSKELLEVKKQDADIWNEYKKSLHGKFPKFDRDRRFLYHCNTWMQEFCINPYGRLKFCLLTDKYSVDLKTTSFRQGFYNVFPQLLNEEFKANSKCIHCHLRPICYHCPARAYLETGDGEAPVPYFCELAKATAEQMHAVRHTLHATR